MVEITQPAPVSQPKKPGRKPGPKKAIETEAEPATPTSSTKKAGPRSTPTPSTPSTLAVSTHGTRRAKAAALRAGGEAGSSTDSLHTASSPATPARGLAFRPATNEFTQQMRNELVAHRATAAAGIWLSHQEKLWSLFNLEKRGSALTYVPVSLRPPGNPNSLPDLTSVFSAAAPLLGNQQFLQFRETYDLSSLPHFVPNLQEVAPGVAALLTPLSLGAADVFQPVESPAHSEAKMGGLKRKAEGGNLSFLSCCWLP